MRVFFDHERARVSVSAVALAFAAGVLTAGLAYWIAPC